MVEGLHNWQQRPGLSELLLAVSEHNDRDRRSHGCARAGCVRPVEELTAENLWEKYPVRNSKEDAVRVRLT